MSTLIIAEAGVNHNGQLGLAEKLVDAAADAGADAIKFQTFSAEQLVASDAPKAAYQLRTTNPQQSQFEMLKELELAKEWHAGLKSRAEDKGLVFMSTAFDTTSLDFLIADVGIERLKIPSGELTNGPLLLAAATSGLPLILSTGMATLDEIEQALGVLAFGYVQGEAPGADEFLRAFASSEGRAALRKNVTLLHCTTDYPAPFEDVDLKSMKTLSETFGLAVGLSDHSPGITVPIAATALGARVIEKHFTTDKTLPGPDHPASLDTQELKDMVVCIRQIEAAMGQGRKGPKPSELGNMDVVRKSLVALCPIAAGEVFSATNIGPRRPGDGISPMLYWDIIGTTAAKAFNAGEKLEQ